jgi:hypothetical protein
VKLGECIINELPPNLPEGSEIDVTIRYDAGARVHVEAIDVNSGKKASVEIIRQENLVAQLAADHLGEQSEELKQLTQAGRAKQQRTEPRSKPSGPKLRPLRKELEDSDEPVPLDENGQPIDISRLSHSYEVANPSNRTKSRPVPPNKQTRPMNRPSAVSPVPAPPTEEEILELDQPTLKRRPPTPPASRHRTPTTRPNPQTQPAQHKSIPPPSPSNDPAAEQDEDEFWSVTE